MTRSELIERLRHHATVGNLPPLLNEAAAMLEDDARRLKEVSDILETAVCTNEPDKGVIMLSDYGPTHTEVIGGKTFANVYDHQYFSPLGDALIAAWEKTRLSQ